jgi:RNA polymerase sigma factor (sigma-70 family)
MKAMNHETLNTESTKRLLAAFKAGDETAFSGLYKMYVNRMYNYGMKLSNDAELVKDCIHDVFIRVYRRKDELCTVENFCSYIFISLKNVLIDDVRHRIHSSGVSIDDLTVVAQENIEDTYLRREHDRLRDRKLSNMMQQLSSRQREAITLYYIEEKKYEDICAIMNMNYQSVRNLMHRGLTKLRSCAE